MLRSDYDRICAINRIDTRRKNADTILGRFSVFVQMRSMFGAGRRDRWTQNFEIHKCAFGAPDPIALSFQNVLRPAGLDLGHVIEQLIGISSRSQKPLFEAFL